MKLAFVINVFREDNFASGGEKLFYELVNRSIQDGDKVDLYCTTYLGNQDVLKNSLNKLTFLGHPKDFKYPEKIEAFYNKIKTLTEKENYDFIISENISPPLDIAILQGHSLEHYQKNAGNLFSRILFRIKKHKHIEAQKKWLKTSYRKIIVPSEILKNELMSNFQIPEEKLAVIYPGVDNPAGKPLQPAKNKAFTFGLSAPSFGKKGGYIFLNALKSLNSKGYDFKAKIIYPKSNKNLWLKFLLLRHKLCDKIEFLDYQSDMTSFYRSVDCIVMPSILETFGLVALEAMINSKPAIISSFSGASEIITDGENGFIFDMQTQNHKNLAKKMEIFLNNGVNYEEIAKNAYETALKRNWAIFYEAFKSALR
ncbi:MAG TPA: glycosyltransferase family 4 protein [Candidatus Gastranaerophilales bacterium]|nr:glycosyltransferase family 4 protein [Candidatus Gastranaerophilales bacterium]